MSPSDTIRAWKDPTYREEVSEQEGLFLPDHPSGYIELEPCELDAILGGRMPIPTDYCGKTVFCSLLYTACNTLRGAGGGC